MVASYKSRNSSHHLLLIVSNIYYGKNMALVLQFLIAVIFLLTLGFPINLALAYYLNNNSNDNSTITNATNSTIMENITGGDTVTIPLKPSDKDATLF